MTLQRRSATRLAPRSACACALLAWAVAGVAGAVEVNAILENRFTEQNIPLTVVETDDDIANGSWSFSETNMVGLSGGFDNNRHEFYFSEDGSTAITVDGDTPWTVEFDIRLDATLVSPRKAFQFTVYHPTNAGRHSNINLTTNRSPAGVSGGSDPPGESAMFNGQYNFLRLIGPEDGAPELNLNPSVSYVAGDTVRMKVIHTPSTDGGTTPSTVEHIYEDNSGVYTTGPRDLRNEGVFIDGSRLGFLAQGIAHAGTGTDSYGVTISNFSATIGPLVGDYNNDGAVDLADFTVWRDNYNTDFDLPNRDPENSGDVSVADFESWRANFGNPGAGLRGSDTLVALPEPSSMALLCFLALSPWRRRRSV